MIGHALAIVALMGGAVTQTIKGATVDWSEGTITARGVGPADRHAPAPAVARDAAKVRAIDAAKAVLTASAKALPGVHDLKDDAIARVIDRAVIATMDLGTDGSVTLELRIPIEAVRVAMSGARDAAPSHDPPAQTVIVDATHLKLKPQVGLAIGGWTGPTLFVDKAPADGLHVKATKLAGKSVEIDGTAPASGARVVVVIGAKS
ncbi:MAG TPA: hypothetical protein VL463_13430 [Kofleriaceae bacterium]|nr:hypothetical protein [Kofleriaceae bacterium]